MTRITEPHWGLPVGRVDAQGNVVISGQFANVMRALVKQLATTSVTAEAAAAAVASGASADDLLAAMYGTNGIDILGSIASGVEIRGPSSASGLSLGKALDIPNLVNFY